MRNAVCLVVALACSKSHSPSEQQPHHEDRHEPAAAPARLKLDVTVDGAPATWSQDMFDHAPRMAGTASDGEARDTWSLRELVRQAAGRSARVVAVVGDTTKQIDLAAWNDASRTPILHTTRRGTLKFRWADAAGKWGETEVKDAMHLELVSR